MFVNLNFLEKELWSVCTCQELCMFICSFNYENVSSKFAFFHRFLNWMSFASKLALSTRVIRMAFWPYLGIVKYKFKDLTRASPPGPPPGLYHGSAGAYSAPRTLAA